MAAKLYLIPIMLSENQTASIPAYVIDAVKECSIFFVENERTARRALKLLWKEIIIDNYEWVSIREVNQDVITRFNRALSNDEVIGIMSEAGCPGIADPGQDLVRIAQEKKAKLIPLVGPNSILLALMASGMNGQHFEFHGYLPIDSTARAKAIRQLESDSSAKNSTQIFIETPYRNNQILQQLVSTCHPETRICVASDLTGSAESVLTRKASEWKKHPIDIHKIPAIFLLYSGK